MTIRFATQLDISALANLAVNVYSSCSQSQLCQMFLRCLDSAQTRLFVAQIDDEIVGFCQCNLRHEYVEGCNEGVVGYLEGIFVLPQYRKMGVGKRLVDACVLWAKNNGCKQFASDCELENDDSLQFHLRNGFCVANKIVCFVKDI